MPMCRRFRIAVMVTTGGGRMATGSGGIATILNDD